MLFAIGSNRNSIEIPHAKIKTKTLSSNKNGPQNIDKKQKCGFDLNSQSETSLEAPQPLQSSCKVANVSLQWRPSAFGARNLQICRKTQSSPVFETFKNEASNSGSFEGQILELVKHLWGTCPHSNTPTVQGVSIECQCL